MKLEISKTNRQNVEDIYPLSPMQEGMLFESLYAPDSGVYFVQAIYTLTGNIDVKAFEQAWQQVVARHSIFRTAFLWESLSQPVQVVYRQVNLTVHTYNWQDLSALEQQQQLETFLSSERQQSFQLSQAPLMRLHLIQMSGNTYQFVWCHHHLLLDGWSLSLVFKDLLEFYQAISQGESLGYEPTVNYRNYIAWLQQQDKYLAEEFWRQKLQGFSAPTPLTVDKPLSDREEHSSYSEQEIHLTVSATAAVGSFVRQHQLTINNLVQATWGLLLSRYSGESDVVFGATVSGRPPGLVGVESMVGLFINTLPVRIQISENTELLSLLKDLQAQQIESEQFSYSSLVAIQGFSDVPRGTSLFESIVVFENYPVDTAVLEDKGSFSISNVWALEHTNYPLTIIAASGEQLLLKVSYDASRFEHGTISRMLGHFVTLLEAIVANPQQRISQLPMVTESESRQLLVEWNDTRVDYSQEQSIHQLFEQQVVRTPDAVAVVFEAQQLTYEQLNSRANQLAHYLQSLGVSADVLVGICVERSLEMLVGILGILKAGGAYVPLDPEYPQERLSFILEDAAVSVLLSQQHLAKKLPEHQAHVVYLDSNWEKIAQKSNSNPENGAIPSNLAYVIYTSGSTGLPKGVLVNHSNVARLFAATEPWYDFNSQDVWTLFHSYAFDFSVWEIWGALLYGGKLVVAPYLVTRSPESFYELLCQEKVTILNQTPSAFRQLIPAEQSTATVGDLNLRFVIFGGEALEPKSLQPWFERHGDQSPQLVNMYGITETTVHVTYRPLSKGDLNSTASVIGRPIPDLQVYVLDQHLQPVPIGVPGEIYVGGAGVTRGYLNREELTAGRFISNPFQVLDQGGWGGARLYKTGDLARYLPDGNIEYLGRIDNQVKIRGFRIELGEIEAVLSQHEDVQASVVIARVDTTGDQRLVAYIVTQPDHTPTVGELRSFLKSKLPDYMVPSAIVILESLPLTPNGKVDKRALKAPEPSSELSNKFVAPRTPVEEILSIIWVQVLKVEPIGIHDNFFELGGHSLLATQLISRVRTSLKVELPLRSLFAEPTIAQLSQNIQQLQQQDLELSAPPILRRTLDASLPLSYAQQRLWFLDQFEPNSPSYNIPGALRLFGSLQVVALEQSLQEIIHRHEALRTNFVIVDGKAAQIIQTATNWTVSVVDLKHLSTSEQQRASDLLAKQHAIEPFDLASDALIRATLVVLSQTEHLLLVCMHHIVSDGWSMGVFVEELTVLYNAYSEGRPSPLTPLPIQYADFAIWQREWLVGDVLQRQLTYWQQQLANAPTFLPLPTDRPRPAVQTFKGAYLELRLSAELTQRLTKLSQQQGVTLFMTLLAAYSTLLYRYTGQEDILVGSPIANRERYEIEGLIGCFVNTLVLRTDMSGNPSFKELLPRIRSMALSAYAHQDLPFEMLVEALQPERDISHTPLFQVMFVLQNAPMSEVELSGLTISHLPIESATAKFDLTLAMENTNSGLVGVWEYNTDLFDRSTIERMQGNFVTLLEGIVANPGEGISQIPILTKLEQHQLLVQWNDTQFHYPQDQCIHQLFEEQVARTPNAVAVVFENQRLTYQQLNSRANQLAHDLQSLGVSADVLVGLSVERSLEMVVGILGILKAGGAYVPLDPEYPTERLAFMLEDAQVSVLVTQQHLVEKLPQHQAQLVCIDSDLLNIDQQWESNPPNVVKPTNLAYVIYTSGSTGQPKGVLVNHCNVVRLFAATDSWYKFNSEDVWTLFHSYAFDFSVWEIWGALLYGGRLVIVPYLVTRSPESFYELLSQQQVTVLNQTPSAFRQLIQTEQSTATIGELKLRLVIFGGEALEPKSLQPWFERHGDTRPQLVNMYGITETTVHVTYRPLSKADLHGGASVIGRPIPDLQVYVLDQNLQPVPVGVPGEMYVGGAGVTRGYLNRVELTAQRFIVHGFEQNCEQLLYKTGDQARYLPNGELEYLGRIDQQVKIRGFRIELGEIEALLLEHPAVWESVVIVREDQPGDKRLVAYLVPKAQQSPKASELRSFLEQKLPDYMIPSAFVQLEALPLTVNGKLDRGALPAINTARPELEDDFVAPSTTEEKILAAIWARVLGVEKVGIYDNFFASGGDSIRSIQVLSAAKEQGLTFSVQQIFQHQTIHGLVQQLKTQGQNLTKSQLTQPFSLICEADKQNLPSGIEDAYPLAMLQMGMLYHTEYSKDSAIYHDIFSFHLKAPLDVEMLQVALQDLAAHHPVLRTSFDLSSFSIPLQLVHQGIEIPLLVENWCHLNHSEQEDALVAWFETEKKQHFDWNHPPLLRFFVHRRTQETFNLTLSFHHGILDGWSVASMMSELLQRYLSRLNPQVNSVSPPLSIAFRDFVDLEQQALASSATQDYWRQKLSDSTFTKLPRWLPVSQNTNVSKVGVQEVTLSPEISQGLKQLAHLAEVPLKSVLLTAHLRVLNLLSGNSDVLTGLVANGRPEQNDGERILGLFLNTLPFRCQLSGGTWIDLVQQVFMAEREMLPHRRYPLLQIQKNLGGHPLFETAFNFVHFHVYEQLLGLDNLQVLGGKFFEETNFTFTAQFGVNLSSSEIGLQIHYDASELSALQVNRIGEYYFKALVAMVNQPQERYELYSLLSVEEKEQLLVEWNDTQFHYPQDQCIHQLFEQQVERTPDAVAVISEDQQLTYQQLNSRANQLAHDLQSLGVSADVLVGLSVERSLEMVVGILGILKAGGAYVPLDPEYPTERLAFMLEDAQVSVLVTQQHLVEKLPQHQAQLVCIDSDLLNIDQQWESNPPNVVKPTNLAYVIYTSGSTGQPKGVLVNHCNVVRLFAATDSWYKFNSEDVWTLFHSYAFDFSVWEIWGALLYGGRLVIVPYLVTRSPESFYELLSQQQVTVLNQTPSAFRQLIQTEQSTATIGELKLRLVIFGGEALEPKSLQPWFERHGDTRPQLVNMYGITETTVHVTYRPLSKGDLNSTASVIGRPIPDLQVYVLDQHLQPVPIGVPGEIYVGGAGVTRGYLNREELTAGRFISNPFQVLDQGGWGGARLYKTGDLARYLPDGNIEYLGRIDNQVKIRGFRIELGEIEAVLSQHEDVQASVVIARVDTTGDQRLVAYIVPQPEQTRTERSRSTPTVGELRNFLKSKLPDYMVPSAIVILESLPLTPNGKVDRRALRAPDSHEERSDKFVAPRTPVEEILSIIWAQVLKVEPIGIHDNFFELGGHSLLATQLISRVRTSLKVELPLRSLFAEPTIAQLSQNIQQLQQQDLELSAPPILRRTLDASLPLSYAQQRLWFLDQFEPNSPSYNIPGALRLCGSLQVVALEQSLQEIIHRHEALRTNFVSVDGKVAQIIQTATNWTVSVVDLKHLSTSEQQRASDLLAKQHAIEPFDLASDALIRATLVALSQTEHLLLVCMHHIVSDGWSMGVFVEELTALYNAYSEGRPSPLTPLPIQYADFAIWQREWLVGEVLNKQLSYWKQQLANAATFLPLPTDRPRPAVQTFHGEHLEFELSVDLTQKLVNLSQEQGCTLFMTLLAAFDTLLYRYTGVADILVGTPIANRDRTEIEGLIGFFVNTLVLRTDLSGDPSFKELLPRIRSMALSAYAHQDLPFEMLVEALQPERDISHTPLFQVMFVLQNAPMSEVELSGLTMSHLPIESATAKFDLTLAMENTTTGLVGGWEYNTDLFERSTIERMAGHFRTLLSAIVANPQERISQLPMLRESEQQQLLIEWNETQADYPQHKCIHQLFEEQVERTPHAVAVVFENQQLTYEQLNSRANQLAHYLRSLGVSADMLVGICVERSIEMVVGLLGILKAGGAYVPIDPHYPQERLSFMLEDTQLSVLLTQEKLVNKLPSHTACVICLDTNWNIINEQTQKNPNTSIKADNLAYVMYTSGSTGQPKGVSIVHRGVVRLVKQTEYVSFSAEEVFLQVAPMSFDAATFEIWGCLLNSGKLVVFPANTPSLDELGQVIEQYQVTTLWLTAGLFHLMVDEKIDALKSLRQLLAGGDILSVPHVQKFLQTVKDCQLINGYGPTENTTFTCCYQIPTSLSPDVSVPIGRPIANTVVYILDQNLQPVPIGVPGELHIGGAGLARGYLNRPELTLLKFIPNPFSTNPDSRLYKTGDLARYLPDGNIEYLGRIDNQVKIRGFRIELGEIEAYLSQHENVQTSVVIARVDTTGDKRLVAYIVPNPEVKPTTTELRSFLSSKLPDYMVPRAFVILESLPLTPNGKIDRRALPVPESRTGIEAPVVAPRTPVEEKLAQIWAQVLRVELVSIHDNFFSLGGDSILSIQIITRAKQAGLELTVKQLFANQTIAELATVAGTTNALQIEQGLVTGTLPLTPIQQWFFAQDLPQKHHFNQSFLFSVPSNLKPEILEQVWQELLKHHDALRLRFTQTEVSWQQIHAAPSEGNIISRFDLSTVPESELETAIETIANELQTSLNLSENLVQVGFFWLGMNKRARLLIVIHHLVVDGVSWRILLEDLHTAYQQLSQGKGIQLPAKTTSFKDWAQKLTEYAQSEVLKSELAYWVSESRLAVARIPVDYAQGVNTAASAHTISVSLSEAETRSLLQDVPKAYKTQINDVLLTALVMVLSRWTNSLSVLFNLEGHGREEIVDGVDLSRTIGWFTTIFPVLVELGVTDNLGQALKSVKEQLRAIPNKGIGYGLLRYLNLEQEISAQLQTMPIAEISFNYLGQFTQVLNTSSLMQQASEPSGQSQSLQGQRPYLLDINAIITNEQLQIDWTYSSNIHQQRTIENIAQEFVETLRELIAHCLSPENGGYTPTDFPLIKLNQLELDGVLARLALKPEHQSYWQNIEDIYPLSPMQEGMLFESLYAPDSGVYFEQVIYTLTGNVDVEAFEQAWQQVVARHSIFRTAFLWESLSQPVQVVYRHVLVTVDTMDLRELSALEQQQQLEMFLSCERKQGFQLSQAPLMRLHLIQMSGNTYQFVWSFHHLLLDGWSLPLVLKDLLNFYQAISQGESLPNIETVNYRNYIAWLQQQDKYQAEEFWRQKLQGFSAPTPLTVDKPLSNREEHSSYSEQEIHLTVSATAAVGSFARQHQLTINNLVQATWGLLLSRYSGESDVVFGATVSGRPPGFVGVESMVGLFINTLPVRIQISENTELLSLLKDLQAQQVESEQFSYSPLVEIQGLSDVPRRTSLFESIVVFENYPVDTAVLQDNGSFSISNSRSIEQTNYPLTILAASGEQFFLKVIYDASRFEHGTISRMLGHFVTLLEAIVANPEERISQLPMLTESERQQLLVEWNQTQVDYPQDQCIHQLFEEILARTPDAVAVVFGEQQLTYRELNTRGNQLAHYLQSLGVQPDELVGICVERSLDMIVGLLAILKAGGAYLPLDPQYPQQRLSFMLEDAQIRVLLSQQHLVERLKEHTAQLVCLDTDWQLIAQSSQDNLNTNIQASNLAYVIYTSGSTGQPKGVEVTHRGVNRLLFGTNYVQLDATQRLLQMAPISFDASTFEIWGALLHGGLCAIFPHKIPQAKELADEINKHGIKTLWLTSALFNSIIDQDPQALSGIRQLLIGGEALSVGHVRTAQQRLPQTQIINGYGPTESTTFTCCYPLPEQIETSIESIPIGKPIGNTQVYILDKHLQPVPVGVPGELHIGGAGLARGYLNRPELTCLKFIPNPFDNSKLYKTGDLARYLPDGKIEYLGRIDNQVKIRGFRIELGEIEAVLGQHEHVQASVVIVREDTPGDKHLVAYIVSYPEVTLTVSILRSFLKSKLPDYMVPSAIVILESLPLTPNGKIDKRALSAPVSPSTSEAFVPPRNTVELQLVQIWSKILKVHNVGVKDNFFDLGGHSLLAPYLIAQIKQQFGKDIPLANLFQHPTIEELASVVQTDTEADSWSPLVAIQPMGSNPPLFCLPGAGGFPFYLYNLARSLGSEQPFYSFQAHSPDGELAVISRVEDIATQYLEAIQAVQPQGPYFLGGHSFGGKVAFEIAQQLLRQGEVVALVAILDTTAPTAQAKPKPEENDDTTSLIETAKLFQTVFTKDLEMDPSPLFSLAPEEQFQYVLDYLKMVDIVPPDADTSYLKRFLQASKADVNAVFEYIPQQVNPIAITLFRASELSQQEPAALQQSELLQDVAWGWNAFSSEPVDVHFVPGTHVTMMTQPHVQVLAERLSACIKQAMHI